MKLTAPIHFVCDSMILQGVFKRVCVILDSFETFSPSNGPRNGREWPRIAQFWEDIAIFARFKNPKIQEFSNLDALVRGVTKTQKFQNRVDPV